MVRYIQRSIMNCLLAVVSVSAMARSVRFRLELWQAASGPYVMESTRYRDSVLIVKTRRTIDISTSHKAGKTIVWFKPSKRQVVEACTPTLEQPNEFEDAVDEFLLAHPLSMTFGRDHSVELNLQKNLDYAEAFYKRLCEHKPVDSPIRNLKPNDIKATVDMNSQLILGLFINQMVFSTEFDEGRFTYRFQDTGPIREADFELRSTLYGYTLRGEASVLNASGRPITKNTYQFDFSPELDVLERMSMEVRLLEGDARDVFVLTK